MLKPLKCVILITIDSLRRDHLSCYGYSRNTTPNIDALGKRGIVFNQAISTGPYTIASFKSIMTSTYPLSFGGYHSINNRVKIAEILHENGYYTWAFPNLPLLTAGRGYADGFDYFKDPLEKPEEKAFGKGRLEGFFKLLYSSAGILKFNNHVYAFLSKLSKFIFPYLECIPGVLSAYTSADVVRQKVLSAIRQNKEMSLFVWAHYMDVHTPYNPTRSVMNKFQIKLSAIEIAKLNVKQRTLITKSRKKDGRTAITQDELDKLIDLYDCEINYVDEQIGLLVDELREMQVFEDTLIIITADHGDEFWEHGAIGHGGIAYNTHLYDELIRVPLVFHHPQLHNGLINNQISILDLAPTIIDMLRLPAVEQFQGRSLLPLIFGEGKREEAVISEASAFNKDSHLRVIPADEPRIVSYRTQDWKYIYNEIKPDELYSLKNDPTEQQNLIDEEKELAGEFRRKILAHVSLQKAFKKERIKERISKLKELGKI